jgi:hypothetical protein
MIDEDIKVGEGDNEVDLDGDRQRRSKHANDTYEEDEERHTPQDNPLHKLGVYEEEEEKDEDVLHRRSLVGDIEGVGGGTLS